MKTPSIDGAAIDLFRQGANVVVSAEHNPAGGAEDERPTIIFSTDDGKTWVVHPDPCGPNPPTDSDEVDSTSFSGAQGTLVDLCVPRGQDGADFLISSTDGGKSWGPHHPLALSATTVTMLDPQHLLVEGSKGSGEVIDASDDSGSSFVQTASLPGQGAGHSYLSGPVSLGAQTATTAHWLPSPTTIYVTQDAGRSCAAHSF